MEDDKDFIEKSFFADEFQNRHFTLDIYWEQGEADFYLIDPDGPKIGKENVESNL